MFASLGMEAPNLPLPRINRSFCLIASYSKAAVERTQPIFRSHRISIWSTPEISTVERRRGFSAYQKRFAYLRPKHLPGQGPFGRRPSHEYRARNRSGVDVAVPALPAVGSPNRQAAQTLRAGDRSRGAILFQGKRTGLPCLTKKVGRHRHPQSSPATAHSIADRFAF